MERIKRTRIPSVKGLELCASQRFTRGRGDGHGRGRNRDDVREEAIAQKIAEGRSSNPYISVVSPSIDVEVIPLSSLPVQVQNVPNENLHIDPFNIGIDFASPSLSGVDLLEEPKFDLMLSNFGSTNNFNDSVAAFSESKINIDSFIPMSLANDESFANVVPSFPTNESDCLPTTSCSSENLSLPLGYVSSQASSEKLVGGFLKYDQARVQGILSSSENPSVKADTWVRNRFDQWRIACGLQTCDSIEKLPLREFGTLLAKFFSMLCKQNGELYPSGTIMNLLQAFNRILCLAQDERIILIGVSEPQFNIKKHPWFIGATKVVVDAMKRSKDAGATKERRKVDGINFQQEQILLSHPCNMAVHPSGCQKRFAWFCVTEFLIRGGSELHKLLVSDFSLEKDENGEAFLRYDEWLLKVNKPSMKRFQQEHFRPPISSFNRDVIETFATILAHMLEEPKNVGPLFLSPIQNARSIIWYKKGIPVGESTIRRWIKGMMADAGIEGDFTNKSGRITAITRMSIAQVPRDIITRITGHHNEKTLARYDQSASLKQKAAQALSRQPYDTNTGAILSFNDHYEKELHGWHRKQILNPSNQSQLPSRLHSQQFNMLSGPNAQDVQETVYGGPRDSIEREVQSLDDDFWKTLDLDLLERTLEASRKSKLFKEKWKKLILEHSIKHQAYGVLEISSSITLDFKVSPSSSVIASPAINASPIKLSRPTSNQQPPEAKNVQVLMHCSGANVPEDIGCTLSASPPNSLVDLPQFNGNFSNCVFHINISDANHDESRCTKK